MPRAPKSPDAKRSKAGSRPPPEVRDHEEHEGEEASDEEGEEREASESPEVEAEAEIVDEETETNDLGEPAEETEVATSGPVSSASLTRLDPMSAYLREVQRHPLLTPEERTHAASVIDQSEPTSFDPEPVVEFHPGDPSLRPDWASSSVTAGASADS